MFRSILTALALSTSLLSSAAMALNASQTVEREVVIKNADGSETIKRERADMVTPGDKVIYSLIYHNDEAKPAENIVLVMPIPAEVKFLEGSADATQARTSYSADGGKTFTGRAELIVARADGSTGPAQAEDITHIRWIVGDVIAPGARGTLSFAGRLK